MPAFVRRLLGPVIAVPTVVETGEQKRAPIARSEPTYNLFDFGRCILVLAESREGDDAAMRERHDAPPMRAVDVPNVGDGCVAHARRSRQAPTHALPFKLLSSFAILPSPANNGRATFRKHLQDGVAEDGVDPRLAPFFETVKLSLQSSFANVRRIPVAHLSYLFPA